jgi:hypothetical protein
MTGLCILLMAGSIEYGYAADEKSSNELRMAESLQTVVNDIITGTNVEQSESSIDAEAYIIDGKYFEPLSEAVRGTSSNGTLVEGADSKLMFQNLVIADDKTSAFVVMKTSSPKFGERFHSIVLFRESNDGWKIKSWHVSN